MGDEDLYPRDAHENLSMAGKKLITIFTRFPVPGKTKTRLIPMLGDKGAARLQRDMTLHMIEEASRLLPEIAVELCCEGGSGQEVRDIFGPDVPVGFQSGGDLGERMLDAFRSASGRGFERIVLIGTDCPFITRGILGQAFDLLEKNDCVLGPAHDGGYYLVGLNRPCPEIFTGISWGSSEVLEQTISRARVAGLSICLLEKLSDIDRPEDIPLWEAAYKEKNAAITAIIPILNEGAEITETLNRLRQGSCVETIVVDGGSSDGTPELAASLGAEIIRSPQGRAVQMNAGAMHARSGILLFLHADTLLPDGFDRHIRNALADPSVIAGSFSLKFDDESLPMKITAWGANMRSRALQLPYGDQAFFLKNPDFRSTGGFPDLPIMEDAVFIRELGKEGRIVTLPQKVITSARRYRKLGAFHTWLINQCLVACFTLGTDPAALSRLYRMQKGTGEWLALLRDALLRKLRSFTGTCNLK